MSTEDTRKVESWWGANSFSCNKTQGVERQFDSTETLSLALDSVTGVGAAINK